MTSSHDLPFADIAMARLAAATEELGVQIDTLVMHPNENYALKVAYDEKLDLMLKSAGV